MHAPPSPAPAPHVLVLIDHLNRERGGAENQAILLLRGMPPEKARMRVAYFAGRSEDIEAVAAAGVGIDLLPSGPRRLWPISVLRKASGIVRRHRIQVVQTFLPSLDILAPALRLLHPSLRISTSRRCLDSYLPARHLRLLRLSGRFAHAIVANARAVAESARVEEGAAESRLRVIPNAIEPSPAPDPVERRDARRRFAMSDDDFVIAYPAHFRDGKGHKHLVDLLRRLLERAPRALLAVAGDEEGEPDCVANSALFRAEVRQSGLENRVRRLGLLPGIRPLLAAADVALNLSETEGMSNTIMEAMAAGLPVVATRVGGTPELIEDGREGWLIPAGDLFLGADRLALLAGEPEARRRMAAATRERVLRDFSVARMADSYAALYRGLLEPRS
ncbi:MAG: glycosyltransferase [Candidatus Eisenbacteria bacterium]|nr:glycosyltransferase [Candidatus Eisenbacteria bacterium]